MTGTAESFAATLVAAQGGDERAVAALWRELNPRILRYLRGRNYGDVDDVASEAWIAIARGLPAFEGNEIEFRAWVFTIARNRMIDAQRRAQRLPTPTADPATFDLVVAPDDPLRDALDTLDTDAALRVLSLLVPDQAEVLLLRILAGLDVQRVAEIVGKRPGTVRVLQHRGLRRLAELLGPAPVDAVTSFVARTTLDNDAAAEPLSG
jgi:RNA polymerase sigma-70 factor (ECF subfamily)